MSEYKFHKLLFRSVVFKMRYFWLSYFCNETVTLVSTARCCVRVSVSEEHFIGPISQSVVQPKRVFLRTVKNGERWTDFH
jgi:hypothetical protein